MNIFKVEPDNGRWPIAVSSTAYHYCMPEIGQKKKQLDKLTLFIAWAFPANNKKRKICYNLDIQKEKIVYKVKTQCQVVISAQ